MKISKRPLLGQLMVLILLVLLSSVTAFSASPIIDSIEPNHELNDSPTAVNIIGSNFDPDTRAALYGGGIFKAGTFSTNTPVRDLYYSGGYAYLLASSDFEESPIQSELQIVDISNPENPILVSSCKIPGHAWDVYVSGQYAYVVSQGIEVDNADGSAGLRVMNISDPTNPTIVGSLAMDQPLFLHVSGIYAYITLDDRYDAPGGLKIVDVSDPANPLILSTYSPLEANGIYVSDNYAYVCNDFHGLLIMDVSDPQNLVPIGSCGTSGRAHTLTVSGNYAYVVSLNDGVDVIDITDPANPINVGEFPNVWQARDIYISESRAYVADGTDGLKVFDISDPTNPIFLARFDQSYLPWFEDVSASGDYAYVACSELGLQIINTSNPIDPSIVGAASAFSPDPVFVYGNYAYTSGLRVIDVSDPTYPSVVNSTWVHYHDITDIFVSGNYAYVTDYYVRIDYAISADAKLSNRETAQEIRHGFSVYDISDPANPVFKGSCATGNAHGVFVSGIFAYVCAGDNFLVVNVSQPENPTIIGNCSAPDFIRNVEVRCNYAYVAGDSGLAIFDVSNPNDPVLVGNYPTPKGARDVHLSGDYAFVADESGFYVINIAANPGIVGSCATPNAALSVSVSGSFAYVADMYLGILVIDISNPSNPKIVGSSDQNIKDLFVSGNYVYAGAFDGLKILRKFELLNNIVYVSDNRLEATVPAGYPVGTYNLHVVDSTGTRTTLNKAFTVEPGSIVIPGDGESGSLDENSEEEYECGTYHYSINYDNEESGGEQGSFLACFIQMLILH